MKIWIYGEPFTGKTTFASQFEDAVILSTDGNAEYLFPPERIYRVKSKTDLDLAVTKLRAKKPKTLVVDTIGYLYDYIRLAVLTKNNASHESELPYKGYSLVRTAFWDEMVGLANICDDCIFISHETVFVEKNQFGREVTYYKPAVDDKLLDKISGFMTVVMRAVRVKDEKGSPYRLHINQSGDEEFGGSRIPIKQSEIECSKKAFEENLILPAKKEN